MSLPAGLAVSSSHVPGEFIRVLCGCPPPSSSLSNSSWDVEIPSTTEELLRRFTFPGAAAAAAATSLASYSAQRQSDTDAKVVSPRCQGLQPRARGEGLFRCARTFILLSWLMLRTWSSRDAST